MGLKGRGLQERFFKQGENTELSLRGVEGFEICKSAFLSKGKILSYHCVGLKGLGLQERFFKQGENTELSLHVVEGFKFARALF